MIVPGRFVRYSKAVSRWIAAGRPVRSDQRVQEIFDECCRPCGQLDAENGRCRLCGCRVRTTGPAYLNKLKMATEVCPDNPPRWV